jgi:hypothetical protein
MANRAAAAANNRRQHVVQFVSRVFDESRGYSVTLVGWRLDFFS